MADVNQTTDQTVQPTGIRVEPTDLQLQVDQEELVLVSVEPADAEQKISTAANAEFVLVTALGANDQGQLQFRLKAVKEGSSDVTFKAASNSDIAAVTHVAIAASDASEGAGSEADDQAAPAPVVGSQESQATGGDETAPAADQTASSAEAPTDAGTDSTPASDANAGAGAAPAVDSDAPAQESSSGAASDADTQSAEQPANTGETPVGEGSSDAGQDSSNPAGNTAQEPTKGAEGSGSPAGSVAGEPVETPSQEESEPPVAPAPGGDGTVNGEEPVYEPQPEEAQDPLEPEVDPEQFPEPTGDGTVNGEKPVFLPDPYGAVPNDDGPANAQGRSPRAPQEGGDTNPPVPEKFSPVPEPEEPKGDGSVNGEKPVPFVQDAYEYRPYETDLSVDNPLPPARPAPAYPHHADDSENPYNKDAQASEPSKK